MGDREITIRGRFKRSVDLVRDFHDASSTGGYIVTPMARKVFNQFGQSINDDGTERAWTITGPYGSGKSAFALFASHLLRGSDRALDHLREADAELASLFEGLKSAPLCPVLVSGARKSLNSALLTGLSTGINAYIDNLSGANEEVDASSLERVSEEASTLAASSEVEGEDTFRLFVEAAGEVRNLTGGGLFVVVDELGKLLEYAALNPAQGDIFVLQQLAEHASRTSAADHAPILLVTILHQAFERYASHLDQKQREEWQKVQGRFEDVAYVDSADATLQLLAEAIVATNEDKLAETFNEIVSGVTQNAQLPKRFDNGETRKLLCRALPLHPLVALLVGPLFRRLAQNERSLFAFLASGEANGFLDVVYRECDHSEERSIGLYRLDHLYDYLTTTLGATLYNKSTSKLWAETEAALGRMQNASSLSDILLKQIALLNFAGEMAGLETTTDLLHTAIDVPTSEIDAELKRLVDERIVVHRKYNDTYAVWQGSDINVEEEIEKARSRVSPDVALSELLSEVVPPSPIAAHRHSYEKGTTRVFDVQYASGDSWRSKLDDASEEADGRIIYVLPDRNYERNALIDSLRAEATDRMTFLAVPDGVGTLSDTVYELKCLRWVKTNTKGLNGDAAARRELRERQADLEYRVEAMLNRLLVSGEDGRNPCLWISNRKAFRIDGRHELQRRLSDACDEAYSATPRIWNELLNLRQPSPSAVRGQKKLLEAMVIGNEEDGRHPEKERLGIKGTPAEYGLYASIVKKSKMHQKAKDGTWFFSAPPEDDPLDCRPTWQQIEKRFRETEGKAVSLDEFYDHLTKRPFGVREGLIPVFLFAYFQANRSEIAVYESGTFLQEVTFGSIERFLKTPGKFAMQQVKIGSVRKDVLRKLAQLVGLPESERKPLPVVIRLLQQVRGLPPFVKKTSRMSEEAMAVREALYRASDPTTLLFEDLPKACNVGVESFLGKDEVKSDSIDLFIDQLQDALREITSAYDKLIREIQRRIAAAFELRGESVDEQRHELAGRARKLEAHVSDDAVKLFIIRATNEVMDTQAWYESIASLLASSSPVKWRDNDLETFKTELRQVSRKFRTREPLIFEDSDSTTEERQQSEERAEMPLHRIRLGITMLGEPEEETVLHVHPEDKQLVDEMAETLYQKLNSDEITQGKDPQLQLAALGRLIQRLERQRETSLNTNLEN